MVTHILQSSTACARQALTSDPSPHAAFIAIDMQTPALKKRLSARHSSAALRKIPTASRSPGCSIGRSENKPPNKSFASLIDFPRGVARPYQIGIHIPYLHGIVQDNTLSPRHLTHQILRVA